MSDDQKMGEEGMQRLAKIITDAFPKPTPEEEAKREKQAAEHATWKLKQEDQTRRAVQIEADRLREEAAANLVEAERLGRLLAAYPDLRIHTTRGRVKYYYSKAVNGLVNKVSFSHSCSCGSCHDSPLDVWLYLETPDGDVYADPVKFYVGREGPYGGDLPKKGWQATLRDAGISEAVVTRVKDYFLKSAEEVREQASLIYDGYATEDDETPI